MKIIDAGSLTPSIIQPRQIRWADLDIHKDWKAIIDVIAPGPWLRQVQATALLEHRILDNRRNLVIAAPTNSGKSLIGMLVLLDAVKRGKRAVLLEPLRELAREKANDLLSIQNTLQAIAGITLNIQITTGDYRREQVSLDAPPPDTGELIVATPERLEAILRNPENNKWFETVGAICVDEAHMLGSKRRGPTLEYLITYALGLPVPPRTVLMSATIADTDSLRTWLRPCDVISESERYPSLSREVIELDESEDANAVVYKLVDTILKRYPKSNILIFVYQTRSAETLAHSLNGHFADSEINALPYHSQMSSQQRLATKEKYLNGESRCLVCTTALALGVNLPTSHVIVRDITFPGSGALNTSEILQMMGRAGRGNQPGFSSVIVRHSDRVSASELASDLKQFRLPSLFDTKEQEGIQWRSADQRQETIIATASQITALLSHRPEQGFLEPSINEFFAKSLRGQYICQHVHEAIAWLTDPLRILAFRDDSNHIRLTTLGLKATRAILPLPIASGFGQLLRDMMMIDDSGILFRSWTPLDHLIVLQLLYDHNPRLRRFSSKVVAQVDSWVERNPDDSPLLYREWISATRPEFSRAVELLGSLGITLDKGTQSTTITQSAHKKAYLAVFKSIILLERSRGKSVGDIERQWKVGNIQGVEERWRDNMLWLLSGVSQILDIRSFYFHLKETCGANQEQIKFAKRAIRQMRTQTRELQTTLVYCSPLGSVFHSIRSMNTNTGRAVGHKTIKRLESAGIKNAVDLARLTEEDLVAVGIRRDLAKQIEMYFRRRSY